MSVSRMKKLTVFAHRDESDAIMSRLIKLRCVDITDSALADGEDISLNRYRCDSECSEREASASDIAQALALLSRYAQGTRSLVRPRTRIKTETFVTDGSEERARDIVSRTLEIEARQNEIKSELSRARAEYEATLPYRSYDMPLCTSETQSTDVILGALPALCDLDTLGKELYRAGAIAELLSEDSSGKYVCFICCKSDTQGVLSVLSAYGFSRASFAGVEMTAEERLRSLLSKISHLEREAEQIPLKLAKLAEHVSLVEILYDIEHTRLIETENKQKMLSTEQTVMLCGWVPEGAAGRVSAALDKFACAYELSEPSEDDNPPILLQNNGFASNFEWVLGMYSYPKYGRFDPTFIMSIFYFIIFGIMFADAGYGLVLMLACFGGVKLLKPRESMERFLKMFGYCGISCVVFGVLFGAYFGDLPLAIMKNMLGMPEEALPNLALLGSSAANVAVLFDPLQNPMAFLLVSLGIGAVHLIAGMAVKFFILCRDGQVWDAIFDIGAYWLLFGGIALIFIVPSVGTWVTVAAVALIVLTHGRAEKNIIMKFLKGLLGLYDLISYVSDLLSYSRILALGLAAGVIAQVVNILGTMGGATVGGFIGLVIAFVIGHLLNIAINVLGTFVHTSRLQYIEFFGKFYEDGGVPFEPALPSDKYTEEE